jgi:hypothetical protein
MKRLVFGLLVLAGCTNDTKCGLPGAGCTNDTKCGLPGALDIASIEQRDPQTGQCVVTDPGPPCDTQCGPCPETGALQPAVDWADCNGVCDNLNETQCLASTTCHAAYQDTGGPTPTFWGCWNLPPSGAITGACASLDAQTCSEHTDCASVYAVNTGGSLFEHCVTETVPVACSALTTETACKARADCDPVYTGTNCTCDHNGCTCASEAFDHCQTL